MKKVREYLNRLTFANIFCTYVFTLCMIFFFFVAYQSFESKKELEQLVMRITQTKSELSAYTINQIIQSKLDLPSAVNQIMTAIIGFAGTVVGVAATVAVIKNGGDKTKEDMKQMTEYFENHK